MRTKRNILSLGLLAAFVLLPACASITSLTTAKTLPEGDHEITVAAGYSNLKLKVDEEDAASGDPSTNVPNVDVAFRYGLTDKDEIGIRAVNFGAFLIGDYKRNLVMTDKFGLSIGGGLGYTSYTIGTAKNTLFDFYVPVYLDYYVSDMFTVYTAPKYIFRVQTAEGSENYSQVALSGGVKFGKTSGVILEGGYGFYLKDIGLDNGWQFMVGFFF